MEFEVSKRAIAQIHYVNSTEIAGTGFLVADNYVLTCAHVVKAALAGGTEQPVGAVVAITFPFTDDTPYKADVTFYQLDETDCGDDAAVLHLSVPLPRNIQPMPLGPLRQYDNVEVKSFGFSGGEASGLNLTAITEGQISGGWVQLRAPGVTGAAVEEGASGSPVWNQSVNGVVGMMVARDAIRETARIGFLIPTEKLESPLNDIKRHSLLKILEAHNRSLTQQIAAAYQVCRPARWDEPFQTELNAILFDLAQMPAEGLVESKLVQFAACLLNQSQIDQVKTQLMTWTANYTVNLGQLLTAMKTRQEHLSPQLVAPSQPHLLVSVQADTATAAEPYRVGAWLIRNADRYNPKTGEGAETLTPRALERYTEEAIAINLEAVNYDHIPLLLAAYLDEVGARGIDLQHLTIEFFLPLNLINKAIEQSWIPAEFGYPIPLGIGSDCPHVVIRSQDRLDYRRSLGQWQTKWQQLQDVKSNPSTNVFISGDRNLRQLQTALKTALGLKLTQMPQTTKQGEIALLVATGTPVALWVRCQSNDVDWENCIDQQVLNCCIETLPQQILSLRRATAELEDEAERELSQELGHHLSFLWENPDHVPPEIVYSSAPL
ncbi:MAG: trypsin-like peptidase domain-containing protein [Leptolyngbyaceae cyanobacterium RM1_406_9]|nr:trypsin-like peptidase domain-containing protein [Leptolyngbyaceae cyanobacterium RM1_406_9]